MISIPVNTVVAGEHSEAFRRVLRRLCYVLGTAL